MRDTRKLILALMGFIAVAALALACWRMASSVISMESVSRGRARRAARIASFRVMSIPPQGDDDWRSGAIAEHFPNTWVLPGLNTTFLGLPTEQGVWAERCAACGDCILGLTGGICPIARCSKSLLNGPCGGSEAGHCEIDPEVDCAWQLIYDRLNSKDKLNTGRAAVDHPLHPIP